MQRDRRRWAIGGLVLVAAACGGDDESTSTNRDYLAHTREEFVRECQADGGTEPACTDTLECVEQELSFEEWVQLDLDKAAGMSTPKLDEALTLCGYP